MSPLEHIHLGVVCPMANEASTAVPFVEAVLGECALLDVDETTFFAVVDRASTDATRSLLEAHAVGDPRLQVVWAPETRGVADAYVRGYREALAAGCDWIVEIDAGFSHSPADLRRFVAALAGGNDCAFGNRFAAGGRHGARFRRRLVSRSGTLLTNLLLGTRSTDMTSGYEAFTRAALERVLAQGILAKGPFFQTEIKAHCRSLRIAEIPIEYRGGEGAVGRRAIAESLLTLGRLFRRRLAGAL